MRFFSGFVLRMVLGVCLAVTAWGADTPRGPIYLMSITLDVRSGDEVGRKIESGPYDTEQACAAVQSKTGVQQPTGSEITVIECAVSHVDVAS